MNYTIKKPAQMAFSTCPIYTLHGRTIWVLSVYFGNLFQATVPTWFIKYGVEDEI